MYIVNAYYILSVCSICLQLMVYSYGQNVKDFFEQGTLVGQQQLRLWPANYNTSLVIPGASTAHMYGYLTFLHAIACSTLDISCCWYCGGVAVLDIGSAQSSGGP
jgi:hypothetical protein